jgi:hypothetical protein
MKTPRLIIIGILILIALGRLMPMTLFPEPWHPWYLPYTSWWWFAAGTILFPSTLISHALGVSFSNNAYLITDAIWLTLLCLLIYWIPISSNKNEPEEDRGRSNIP